jgi:hypothetical protein
MRFYRYKKYNHKEQFSLSKLTICFEVMQFRLGDIKIFISTLWYDNDDDYDFSSCKIFFH